MHADSSSFCETLLAIHCPFTTFASFCTYFVVNLSDVELKNGCLKNIDHFQTRLSRKKGGGDEEYRPLRYNKITLSRLNMVYIRSI